MAAGATGDANPAVDRKIHGYRQPRAVSPIVRAGMNGSQPVRRGDPDHKAAREKIHEERLPSL
jgi:hypothetical protein